MYVVGIISYQSIMHFWRPKEENAVPVSGGIQKQMITKASVDDISRNIIYCTDDKSGKIEKIVLEIFPCKEERMTFITIPIRTEFTMSEALYQRLALVDSEIPQIIKLSNISKYFGRDTVYDYSVLILEDLLNLDISYYTAIPERIYNTVFQTKETADYTSTVTIEVLRKDFIKKMRKFQKEDQLEDYIKEIYPSIKSNLTLIDKMNYLESYRRLKTDQITFEVICGQDNNSAFTIDAVKVKEQMDACMERVN
jgi:hypothetical protein